MPPPDVHLSRNPILLIAVVERHSSLVFTHLVSPNLPSHHPSIIAAKTALSSAPDFIFPPNLPAPQFSPPPPIHSPLSSPPPTPSQSPATPQTPPTTPTSLPLSSHPAYLALAHPSPSYNSSLRPPSRTFSNLSSLNNLFPSTPTILRRPSSSPSRPNSHSTLLAHPVQPSHHHPCRPALDSANRLFRATLLSTPPHVFAITSKDGSRQYAYCRPLSSTTAILLLTSASHTSVYVSALEQTALIYPSLVDQAITSLSLTQTSCVCSAFIATNIIRCPHYIATNLAASLLAFFNCPSFASPNHVCQHHLGPSVSTSTLSSSTSHHFSTPCLTSSSPLLLTPPTASQCTNSSSHPNIPLPPYPDLPNPHLSTSSLQRLVELADATLLLRHFSIRSLMTIIVALLEERRVCFVGPDTALVSRTVVAIDNFLRPFEWPHLMSPILLVHMLPVLGAPFPFLVGILDTHFAATKQLPLEDVMFADLSTGKLTVVEGPTDLNRHIPRRIRARLERRLTRAKISCTRQVLRSRPSLFSTVTTNIVPSTADVSDDPALNKNEKPSLLKRSRSYAKISEPSSYHVWLEYETTLIIDKAMQKFFADLLDGCTDTRDSSIFNKLEPEPAWHDDTQTVPQPVSSNAMTRSSSRRDSDKHQLAAAFQRTQMFMQWRDREMKESHSTLKFSETRPQRDGISRKRSKDRDSSTKKTSTDPDDDIAVRNPKFKIRLTSDMEDVFSGIRGSVVDREVERKRFRSKRKSSRRQGVRLESNTDEVKPDSSSPSLASDMVISDTSSHPTDAPFEKESSVFADHHQTQQSEPDIQTAPRRPWLSLRLPSTAWSAAGDWTTLSGREKETDIDGYDQFSEEGDETDPFDEVEESAKLNDMPPSEQVGTGWSRVRQWNRRRNRRSARV